MQGSNSANQPEKRRLTAALSEIEAALAQMGKAIAPAKTAEKISPDFKARIKGRRRLARRL